MMGDSFHGGKNLRGPSGHVRFPQEHRRAAVHLQAIGFTPSGIADELNAQFGTSYSRRAVLLELSSPASGNLRGPAAHVRPEADTATAITGRRRLETPPLDAVEPVFVPLGRKRSELRGETVIARAIDKRGRAGWAGQTHPKRIHAVATERAGRGAGVIATAHSPAFSGGRGVPLTECQGCRWPVAGEGAATLFCDATQADGSSYCPGHKALAGNGFSFKGVA